LRLTRLAVVLATQPLAKRIRALAMSISPETLYAEATGRGLPDWMRDEEETTANIRLQADTR
jgi:hypothetical protein